MATCADNLLIACQIESAKAVENIDEILAVDGIDMLFIGPFDLWNTSYLRAIDDSDYIDELYGSSKQAANPAVNPAI